MQNVLFAHCPGTAATPGQAEAIKSFIRENATQEKISVCVCMWIQNNPSLGWDGFSWRGPAQPGEGDGSGLDQIQGSGVIFDQMNENSRENCG